MRGGGTSLGDHTSNCRREAAILKGNRNELHPQCKGDRWGRREKVAAARGKQGLGGSIITLERGSVRGKRRGIFRVLSSKGDEKCREEGGPNFL